MPEIIDPFEKRGPSGARGGGPRGPTAVQNRRLDMAATGESIESANVNQAKGRTELAVDAAVVPSDINKRRADAVRSQMDAAEAAARSKTVGGFATEDERRTAFNYLRMMDAMATRDFILGDPKNKKAGEAQLLPTLVERLPLGDIASNYMITPQRRQIEAANKALLDAALWLSTGAAYNEQQLRSNYQSYFAQPNDDDATIRDKNRRLKGLVDAAKMRAAMGLQTVGGTGALAEQNSAAPGALGAPTRGALAAPTKGTVVVKAPTSKIRADWALIPAAKRPAARKYLESMGYDTSELR